jgi:hypothetical protein
VGGFGDLGFLLAAESFVWGEIKLACPRDGPKFGASILPRAGQPTSRLAVGRHYLPTDGELPIQAIPTDWWIIKTTVFPTESLSISIGFPDQLYDRTFADQQSIGYTDFCRPTSVGNLVLWCSEYSVDLIYKDG